jgi:hypothetical protein
MRAVTRRVYEMCARVLSWTGAHPDDEPGFLVLVAQLQALAARIVQVIAEQRNGRVDSRAASTRKAELRRDMLAGPVAHLAQIGRMAAREQHELASTFLFKPTADTFLAFQAAARGMFAAAQAHKEVLVKHGLSDSVLERFGKMLDEFDATVTLGAAGRTVHTAATRELEALTKEATTIVRAMDARNRLRFQGDRQALEQWVSARTVLGAPQGTSKEAETPGAGPGSGPVAEESGTPAAGGDVRPAA